MNLSTDQLRDEFKKHLHWCESVLGENSEEKSFNIKITKHLQEMQSWSETFERNIENKIRNLENDLQQYELNGEYLRSVTESFDDLDRLRCTHKTLLDIIGTRDKTLLVDNIKQYYHSFFIPLLNILAKLENDHMAILNIISAKKPKHPKHLEKNTRH